MIKVILLGLLAYGLLVWLITLLFPKDSITVVPAPPQPDCPKCREGFMRYEPVGTSHVFACPACHWIDWTR